MAYQFAPLIIGITGPSGCGKSTQCERLAKALEEQVSARVKVFHADDYFLHRGPPPPYKVRGNMEGPETVDWASLLCDLHKAVEELGGCAGPDPGGSSGFGGAAGTGAAADSGGMACRGIILVEGFVLLLHEDILALLSLVLFLEAGREQCLRRRLSRNPDRDAEECKDLARYFENFVWPSYLQHTVTAKTRLAATRCDLIHVIPVDKDTSSNIDPRVHSHERTKTGDDAEQGGGKSFQEGVNSFHGGANHLEDGGISMDDVLEAMVEAVLGRL